MHHLYVSATCICYVFIIHICWRVIHIVCKLNLYCWENINDNLFLLSSASDTCGLLRYLCYASHLCMPTILYCHTYHYGQHSACTLLLSSNKLLYWNVPYWGHQLWDINCCMCVCVCVCVSVCPPTYRYIAPRMIQRIILKFCGYVGCDDATNVSNFGYEPIKFSSFMLNIRMHTMQIKYVNSSRIQHT